MPDFNSLLQQLAEGRNSTFLRFVAVGLLSNLANFVTYLGCIGLGFNYFYAALIGYMVGLVNSFVLGRFFVFNRTESGPITPASSDDPVISIGIRQRGILLWRQASISVSHRCTCRPRQAGSLSPLL